jgi:H+/Cl- antiporter ClcA
LRAVIFEIYIIAASAHAPITAVLILFELTSDYREAHSA